MFLNFSVNLGYFHKKSLWQSPAGLFSAIEGSQSGLKPNFSQGKTDFFQSTIVHLGHLSQKLGFSLNYTFSCCLRFFFWQLLGLIWPFLAAAELASSTCHSSDLCLINCFLSVLSPVSKGCFQNLKNSPLFLNFSKPNQKCLHQKNPTLWEKLGRGPASDQGVLLSVETSDRREGLATRKTLFLMEKASSHARFCTQEQMVKI